MRLLLATTIVLAAAAHAVAQTVPTGFTVDTLVSSGLQAGHDFAFLPDGRVLIANRGGAVMVYAGGAPVTVGTVPSVETGSERGLLGITADPAFASNGYIYVWYSSTADAFLHLDRFTCTGDLANASSTLLSFASTSRRVLLAAVPDNAFNHNGGSPRFGPDGMLYQSIGDDASSCTAQSTTSSLGCVLRMNVGAVPAGGSTTAPTFDSLDPGDNPLSANAGSISQLVIAHGLRNPVRMEIDQATGNLYIGDVGQNAVEEYSEYVRGSTLGLVNFGWPWREGNNTYSTCSGTQPALVAPIAAVAQSGSGWLSVMGGPRYRNQTGGAYNFGAAYEGVGFYLDYFAGQVRAVQNTGSGWTALSAVPGQPNATNWGTNFVGTVSFRQGPDGAIWFLQHPGTYPTTGGTLKRIRPLGPTNSVVAVSGGGQVGVASEAFATPVRVQVRDTNGNALPGGTVNFAVTGGATLSTTNPVVADGNGFAQTNVTATITGGAITVTGSTPGSQTNATFSLFARKLTTTPSGTLLVVSATNTTTASPPNVPYILMASFPGSPILSTSIGPICTDPSYALTVVLEDGTGAFGGMSLSGSGSIGNPSKTWLYTVPAGLLTGYQMKFQAVGLDPVTGWFRTNCDVRQF